VVATALSDAALAGVAAVGRLSKAAEEEADRTTQGNRGYGSFGVDFVCADGGRVMVVALTQAQRHAAGHVTGTADVFEGALAADVDDEADSYQYRKRSRRPLSAERRIRRRRSTDALHAAGLA